MSAYTYCPGCRNESLDVDTFSCDECGWYPGKEAEAEIASLRTQVEELTVQLAASVRHAREEGQREGIERAIRHEWAGCVPQATIDAKVAVAIAAIAAPERGKTT